MNDLDKFGKPIDSPASNNINASFQNGVEFDAQTDRNIIDSVKIRNASITTAKIDDLAVTNAKIGSASIGDANIGTLTFDAIRGGTATFGGTSNGEGLVEVLNGAGGTVVQLNNSGITVTNGSISVTNSAGSAIVDATGVISNTNANFQRDQSVGTNASTSNTAFQDVTGSDLTLTLDRSARVFLYLFVYATNDDFMNNSSSAGEAQIYDTFTSASTGINLFYTGNYFTKINWDTGTGLVTSTSVWRSYETQSSMGVVTFGAGTHTLKLRHHVDTTGTSAISNWRMGYVVFGR